MQQKELGRTGLKVSEICLGTMTWGRQNTEEEGHAQMDYAVEQGINFFDTAELYAVPPQQETQGKTEEIIGTWFKKTGKRQDIILASKATGAGIPWIRGGERLSRSAIVTAVEGNLKRLQTDYIDLYQLHWPNRATYRFGNHAAAYETNDYKRERDTIVDCLMAADELVRAGKIRHFGLSNDTAWGVMTFLTEAERRSLPRIASIQNEYSLLWRWYDKDLAEISIAEDVSLLSYSPLGGGMIAGKYLDGARPAGSRWSLDHRPLHRDTPESQAAIRAYITLAEDHGLDVCQMAIAWCMSRPFMTSTIIGATSMEQLKVDIGAADILLTPEIMQGIDKIYAQHARPY